MQITPSQRLQQGKNDVTALFNNVCPPATIAPRMGKEDFIHAYLRAYVAPQMRRPYNDDDYTGHLIEAIQKNSAHNNEANNVNPFYHHALTCAAGRLWEVARYKKAFESAKSSVMMNARLLPDNIEDMRKAKRVTGAMLLRKIDEVGLALRICANEGVQIQMARGTVPYLFSIGVVADMHRQSLEKSRQQPEPGV